MIRLHEPSVVDTDVVSFLFKNHPIASRYDPELTGRVLLISFMTVAELERWTIQYRWNAQRVHWLYLYLRRFTAVPSSPDLCRKWAEVMVAAQAAGRRIECADAWIAATALLYAAPLVTHNPPDYLGVPWTHVNLTYDVAPRGNGGTQVFPYIASAVAPPRLKVYGRWEGTAHTTILVDKGQSHEPTSRHNTALRTVTHPIDPPVSGRHFLVRGAHAAAAIW
jgi:predicted nucleic acid-binding protein